MAISWYELYGSAFQLGVDWQSSTGNTSVTITPLIYRYDAQNTDNYSGAFDKGISEPDGSWGRWNDNSFGSGSGIRLIDTFSSRTYSRKTSDYNIALSLAWNSSTGTYSGNGFVTTGAGSYTWYLTIPKLASYTVSYNANGGSNAPSSQTKWRGQALTLSSQTPKRANYTFLGWATSSSATSATYKAGASYTNDASVTLYAVWKLAAVAPTIISATFSRCTSNGTLSSEGTYIKAVIEWKVDTAVVTSNVGKTMLVSWSPSNTTGSSKSYTLTGYKGTFARLIGSGDFELNSTYSFTATLTDNVGLTATKSGFVGTSFHTFDIGNKGKSMGLGAASSDSANSLTIGFDKTDINSAVAFGNTATFSGNATFNSMAYFKSGGHLFLNGQSLYKYSIDRITEKVTTKVLWGMTSNSALYMAANQSCELSEKVSAQKHGIILCWCGYSNGQPLHGDCTYVFVPKNHITSNVGTSGKSVCCSVGRGSLISDGYKNIYITDTKLVGYQYNNNNGLDYVVLFGVLGF